MSIRVFITGANRGLGLELVRQYVDQGARVFAAARKPYSGELAQLLQKHPAQLSLIPLEVTRDEEVQAAVEAVSEQTSGLDLLVNNAGIGSRGIVLGKYESDIMLKVLHVNAVAPVVIGQAFLPLLQQGNTPKLVNISSQVGSFGWNHSGMSTLYAASKAALNMYTRSLSREATGLITIAVHPGWVQTDMGGGTAPLTPQQSVQHLRTLFARLTPADNGQFFNYDGKPHPW